MMGEGFHHGHHAKNDIPYSRLPKVGLEVEQSYPDIKLRSRGNLHIRELEALRELPPNLMEDEESPTQVPSERTARISACIDLFQSSVTDAVQEIAAVIIDNALYVAGTADLGLLRFLHEEMASGLSSDSRPPNAAFIPFEDFGETVFAAKTQNVLNKESIKVRAAVRNLARTVGRNVEAQVGATFAGEDEIRENYLQMFKALASTAVSPETCDNYFRDTLQRVGFESQNPGTTAALKSQFVQQLRKRLPESPAKEIPEVDRDAMGEKTSSLAFSMYKFVTASRSKL